LLFELGRFAEYHHGFGSLTMSILVLQHFLGDLQNRSIIVDQSRFYNYRYSNQNQNTTKGLYSGFLKTSFPVLDSENDWSTIEQFAHKNGILVPLDRNISLVSKSGWLSWLNELQGMKKNWIDKTYRNESDFFGHLSKASCHIRFNQETNERIGKILQNHSVPNFRPSLYNNIIDDGNDCSSVAFHIRRGDKLEKESIPYQAKEYIDTLIRGISEKEKNCIRHCFVATDDYRVVSDLATELAASSIHCTLHTFARPFHDNKNDKPSSKATPKRDGNHALVLFVDLKMMIDASFFVGTFNSNIGKLAAMWRGCKQEEEEEEYREDVVASWKTRRRTQGASLANHYNHFYRSYGVDRDYWYYM